MEPLSLVAIAVAVVVTAVALTRAASARRELEAMRTELAALKRRLSARPDDDRDEKAELAAVREEPRVEPEAATSDAEEDEEDEGDEEDEAAVAEVDPSVVSRAREMLREAQDLARHTGFDHEVEVNGRTGVRVTVVIEDELDESAFTHLCATSEAVLEAGTRGDDRFLVIRR